MAHYKDGTQARVGDIVRGHPGFGLDDRAEDAAEITGLVLCVASDGSSVTVLAPSGCLGEFGLWDAECNRRGALVTGKLAYGSACSFRLAVPEEAIAAARSEAQAALSNANALADAGHAELDDEWENRWGELLRS
jgi:hypothetical protein